MKTENEVGKIAIILMHSPGRMRVKVPALYRSEAEKNRLELQCGQHRNIQAIHASTLTSNVLILFDVTLPASSVLAVLGLHMDTSSQTSRNEPPPAQSFSTRSVEQRQPATLRQQMYPAWHVRTADAAVAFHGTSIESGLSVREAQARLKHGRNVLPQKQARSSAAILLAQFSNLPSLLLGISAGLSLLTGGIVEAIAIGAVMALNAGIGFVTERRAEQTIASLSELIDDVIPVLRDRAPCAIAASHVVLGDILILAPGVRVAADARVIHSNGLRIDESALTGESRFVSKQEPPLDRDMPLADRSNMVYMGTAVHAGRGLAVVVGTGSHTEIGAIQSLMNTTELPKTPLQKQLDELGNRCVRISLRICAGVFALGLLRGQGLLQMLKASVSLAVAALPEGLPTVATTSLARGIRLMREKQMLVRHLHAIETLGAIHTLCLDKTGTLTQNRMSVIAVQTPVRVYENNEADAQWNESILRSDHDKALDRLLTICVLSNEVSIQNGEHVSSHSATSSSSPFNGSATENALIRLAGNAGISIEQYRQRFPVVQSELRSEGRNYMKSIHIDADTGRRVVAIKGNPEEVLALCLRHESENGIADLTNTHREGILSQNRQMAQRQLRVLGFAYLEAQSDADIDSMPLIWVGLVGLADPLRPGVKNVIAALHRAGIRTPMITGDQPATAHAIGESLGLAGAGRRLQVVESDQLESGLANQRTTRLSDATIFARVTPAHKLEVVQTLQRRGEVVAMTGDGINDGPALQASDVGIAMGLHGTDLARSAADVVLKDDRLQTVLDAIRQGRSISENIEKSVHFLLASNLSEILVVLGATALGRHAPLSPVQLLWINLLSDVLPAVALAAESVEADIMLQPPREAGKPLIGDEKLKRYAIEGAVLSGGAMAAYLYGLLRHGAGARAGTLTFNSLILGQLLHALFCRSERHGVFSDSGVSPGNKLNLAVGGSIALQLLVNIVPRFRSMLGITRMGMADIIVAAGGAGVPLLINEAAKARRNKSKRQ